jgi:hypothetical protein
MQHRAIETRYKGYRFRSRLEARWAVFFDALGLKWEYEREGYELPSGRYLPDFFIHWGARKNARLLQFREVGYWVEIKGTAPTDEELKKLHELSVGSGHIGYLLAGPPNDYRVWVCGVEGSGGMREWERASKTDRPVPLQWLAFVDCCATVLPTQETLDSAVAKALSARFEHGEAPRV